MKILKNFILMLALMAIMPSQIMAQVDEKYSCYDADCVFKVLEKMKSKDDKVVADAIAEYSHIVDNYRFTGDSRMREALVNSAVPFAGKLSTCEAISYVISKFPKFCKEKDIEELLQFVDNEHIADQIIRVIGDIQGSEKYIVRFIEADPKNINYKGAWAYAVGKQHITSMEDTLISWLKGADDKTKIDIYNALLVIRSNDKTTAIVRKGAKKLNKSKVADNMIAGMRLLVALDGEKVMPELYKAVKNDNHDVRREALKLMEPYANQEVVEKVMKLISKKPAASAEVVEWLGNIKNDSQMQFVIKQLSSKDKYTVEAAIAAIFKIDNKDGITAVKKMYNSDYQDVIKESLMTYEGDYVAVINDMMKRGDNRAKHTALQVAERRPAKELNARVKELLESDDKAVRDVAYKVFKLVVVPANADFLSEKLASCDEAYVEDVQLAIKNAMKNASEDQKDDFITKLKNVKPSMMPRFYNVFAYFETENSVNRLIDAYQNGNYQFEAQEALLLVKNKKFESQIKVVLKP